jgi:hypothetical protein
MSTIGQWGGIVVFFWVSVSIAAPEQVTLHPRPLPARADECNLCHLSKSLRFMPGKRVTELEHKGYPLEHGRIQMSCNSCHDANRSNFLRAVPMFPATWKNSSPVCQRCHAVVFRDWSHGVHGKRTGNWNGEKVQNHCIDCHNPHSVTYKPTQVIPAPVRPRLGVDKEQGEEH